MGLRAATAAVLLVLSIASPAGAVDRPAADRGGGPRHGLAAQVGATAGYGAAIDAIDDFERIPITSVTPRTQADSGRFRPRR